LISAFADKGLFHNVMMRWNLHLKRYLRCIGTESEKFQPAWGGRPPAVVLALDPPSCTVGIFLHDSHSRLVTAVHHSHAIV